MLNVWSCLLYVGNDFFVSHGMQRRRNFTRALHLTTVRSLYEVSPGKCVFFNFAVLIISLSTLNLDYLSWRNDEIEPGVRANGLEGLSLTIVESYKPLSLFLPKYSQTSPKRRHVG